MNLIKQLLTAEHIFLELKVVDKEALFSVIAEKWGQHHHLAESEINDIVSALTAREKLGSTGLGKEIAIPHARLKEAAQPMAALVRLHSPIEFDAPDRNPVSICFMLIVPEHATEQHLQILSGVAEMLANPLFRDQLETATNPHAVAKLIWDWESDLE
jgi:nitrogen PTS system EIIA component